MCLCLCRTCACHVPLHVQVYVHVHVPMPVLCLCPRMWVAFNRHNISNYNMCYNVFLLSHHAHRTCPTHEPHAHHTHTHTYIHPPTTEPKLTDWQSPSNPALAFILDGMAINELSENGMKPVGTCPTVLSCPGVSRPVPFRPCTYH